MRNILVDDRGVSIQLNERITRQQFVAAIQPWLDEVLECCLRALVKGKAQPEDLHQILLVGGSSYGPWVGESLKTAFPNTELRLFNPDLCVGAGAAIHASMALPHGETLGAYCIERETPETSVLDHVHVAGRFLQSHDGRPPERVLSVSLKVQAGTAPEPIRLDENGRFLFKDVELPAEGVNRFTLCLQDDAGQTLAEHGFSVDHVPPEETGASGLAGVTGSTTVLPRPLYIETTRGMVPLAEEGVALPARCVAHFERANSNPNITLKLFQEQEPVGNVRIENIPAEAGVGSPVELTIEITADNQVCGDVVIYRLESGRHGGSMQRIEALRSPIHVSFDPTAIPSAEELKIQFEELRGRAIMLQMVDPELAAEVAQESEDLLQRIERGFENQPFERQEVYVDIRRLRNLLLPPKDVMTPSKREFVSLAGRCLKDIEELQNENNAILGELQKSDKKEIEINGRRMSAHRAAQIIKRLNELQQKLKDLKETGLAAHAQKDRMAWPKSYERLRVLDGDIHKLKPQVENRPDISKLPTPLLKIIVIQQELNRRVRLVQQHARSLQVKKEFSDWLGEITEIMKKLDAAAYDIMGIDDETPSSQALAQIYKILDEQIHALDARIAALGKVLT